MNPSRCNAEQEGAPEVLGLSSDFLEAFESRSPLNVHTHVLAVLAHEKLGFEANVWSLAAVIFFELGGGWMLPLAFLSAE